MVMMVMTLMTVMMMVMMNDDDGGDDGNDGNDDDVVVVLVAKMDVTMEKMVVTMTLVVVIKLRRVLHSYVKANPGLKFDAVFWFMYFSHFCLLRNFKNENSY